MVQNVARGLATRMQSLCAYQQGVPNRLLDREGALGTGGTNPVRAPLRRAYKRQPKRTSKGEIMKRIAAIALVVVAGFLTAASGLAQNYGVRATIPFDFTVGDKLLPPGTYTITSFNSHELWIRNRDKNVSVATIALSSSKDPGNTGKLVFNKYGDQYFLREVLCGSTSMNAELPPSKLEKRVRIQEARLVSNDQVQIALK
jgi:hypothetical protein